jgi:hypothetical protein
MQTVAIGPLFWVGGSATGRESRRRKVKLTKFTVAIRPLTFAFHPGGK